MILCSPLPRCNNIDGIHMQSSFKSDSCNHPFLNIMATFSVLVIVCSLFHDLPCSNMYRIPHHIFTNQIAESLPTKDLLSLLKINRLMNRLLGPMTVLRFSMLSFIFMLGNTTMPTHVLPQSQQRKTYSETTS